MEFEVLVNPPQAIFDQIVHLTSQTEGWSHQLVDYHYWRTNFDGYWLYTVVERSTQKLVASVSLARWDDPKSGPLFSIGLFYCAPKYRGQGHANRIWNEIMKIIGAQSAVLFGALKMSEKYEKVHGFDKTPEFWHNASRFEMADLRFPDVSSVSDKKYSVKWWHEAAEDELAAFDATICRRNRWRMMKSWFGLDDTFTKMVLDENGTLVGYGTIRIVVENRLSVAPFYAQNLDAATSLLAGILREIPNVRDFSRIGFLYPAVNEDAPKLLERFTVDGKFETSRAFKLQFNREFVESPHEKVYSASDITHQFV